MEKKDKVMNFERYLKIGTIVFLDFLSIYISYFVALWLRFDLRFSGIPSGYFVFCLKFAPLGALLAVCVFFALKLYSSVWSFVSGNEVFRIVLAYALLSVIGLVYLFTKGLYLLPTSVYVIGFILSFICTIVIRFSYRFLRMIKRRFETEADENKTNVMIIGAGSAGMSILGELDPHISKVRCFIDDSPAKKKKFLHGIPIAGNRNDIEEACKRYEIGLIIFAIPSASNKDKKEILEICAKTGCQVQVLPGVYQLVNGDVSINQLRKVDAQDLLGRDPIKVNNSEILQSIAGKTVMVTGGGGSIGSELCRQIAKAAPRQLIIFDIYENNAYDIQQELLHDYPELNLVVLIGSVRNTARLDYVMSKYRPELVFHAAAHKHVPLMEDSPNEAIKNNVFGTLKMAEMSAKYGVKRFVLISTDKAVNPTNIMGASKRLCEMVVQMMNRQCPNTEFVAVRFGNVLGSNGSVIPLFKKQIEEGGPVTVTHPDITRFFMTIPEAVSLVLQAAYYAKGGEIFVLDMGQPVRIDDMARNLIRFSGLEPDVDIKIEYTGLRPGEKLYEELLMDEEGLQDTENSMIHIGKPIDMDDEKFKNDLERLRVAYQDEVPNMKELVAEVVPTYHIQED